MERKGKSKIWLLAVILVIALMAGRRICRIKKNVAMCNPSTSKHGMVTAIIHAEENPSALINLKIVHEGDTIDDVKVVQIQKNEVHFEKNANRWTQRVDEQPNHAWSQCK